MGISDAEKRARGLEDLLRVSSVLADETLGLGFRLQETTNAILKILGARSGSIMLVEKDDLVVRAASNPRILGFRKSLKESSISTDVIRTGRMSLMRKQESEARDVSSYQSNFSATLPLFSNGRVIGVLNLTDKENAGEFTPDEIDFIEHFKKWIEIILENMWLKHRVEELSNKNYTTLDHPSNPI
jgi:GAF domain-containing protein